MPPEAASDSLTRSHALAVIKAFGWVGAVLAPVHREPDPGRLAVGGGRPEWRVRRPFLSVFSLQLHAQMVTLWQEVCAAGVLLREEVQPDGRRREPCQHPRLLSSSEGIAPALRSLASAVDLFSLWYWGLVVLGLAVVARMPKVRILVPAAVFWALGVVLKAATLSLARGPPEA